MRDLGIACGADLQARGEQELVAAFGRVGAPLLARWRRRRDDRLVEPDRPRRSLSVETTFEHDLRERGALEAALAPLAEELAAARGASRISSAGR